MTLALDLRQLAETHGPRPTAAALARTAPPLARAALALDTGLLGQVATRDALEGVTAAALTTRPVTPSVPASHREVWLRTLAAHVLLGTPWAGHGAPGTVTTSLIRSPDDRLAHATDLGAAFNLPVTYAAPSWAAAQAAQDWVDDENLGRHMEVITLEEAVLTLGAASRPRLRHLAQLRGRLLVLDGLHRLDPRGLRPVQALIDEHAALGLHVHLTGAQPWPVTPEPSEVPGTGPRVTFTNATWATSSDDLVRLVEDTPEQHTLIMLPSRAAALALHARLPWGQLQARAKTAAHLRDEQDSGATLHISTWSPSALTFRPYDRVIVTPMPLPVLADACLAAPDVTLVHTPEYPVPASTHTATFLTTDLLSTGAHPQDPAVMRAYWDALLPHVQQDSLNIQRLRAQLEYPQVAAALTSLFRSGVPVLVDRPDAAADVQRARHTGRMPGASPHTVRVSPTSLSAARNRGWIEDAGDAIIWTGPYTSDRGVGVG